MYFSRTGSVCPITVIHFTIREKTPTLATTDKASHPEGRGLVAAALFDLFKKYVAEAALNLGKRASP
jgi:hypothetical protein